MCKILAKYLIGGDKRTSYAQDTTKQNYQTEKMNNNKKKTVRNVIATNKVKRRSRLDIDKNVRLERKGTFIARNIEVKVNKKKLRNSARDTGETNSKIIGMQCMQELLL